MASKVAACLERVRKENDWSYRDLAKALGVPLSQAHNWASGKHDPNMKSLRRMSRRLDLDLGELIA